MLDDLQRAFQTEMLAREPAPPRPAGTKAIADNLSGVGAARIAAMIKTYWSQLGFQVSVTIEPGPGSARGMCYGIRSDLVGGLPRR